MPWKTDSEVEQWVLRELRLSEEVCSREVCFFACDGVVRLRGSAQSEKDKLAIEEAARRASGVVGVVNQMRVKPCDALIERVSASVPLTVSASPGRVGAARRGPTTDGKGGAGLNRTWLGTLMTLDAQFKKE